MKFQRLKITDQLFVHSACRAAFLANVLVFMYGHTADVYTASGIYITPWRHINCHYITLMEVNSGSVRTDMFNSAS